ncbi:MAG: hypothetical protein WBL70_15990 [Candidatus Acidiferrales bacterium]
MTNGALVWMWVGTQLARSSCARISPAASVTIRLAMWTARVTHEQAYPGIRFLPRSRNWWAKLKGVPAECVHLDAEQSWIASLVPDTLYLRGKAKTRRDPVRPEVTLCRDCCLDVVRRELEKFRGRVLAFEPDPGVFSQYFFVSTQDFPAAGLLAEVQEALGTRLAADLGACEICAARATWEWFTRDAVPDLGDVSAIANARDIKLCAEHGAMRLCDAFEAIPEASVYYMNLPYDDSGAYVWI